MFLEFDVSTVERCELCSRSAMNSISCRKQDMYLLDIQQSCSRQWDEVSSLDVHTLCEAPLCEAPLSKSLDQHLDPSLNMTGSLCPGL